MMIVSADWFVVQQFRILQDRYPFVWVSQAAMPADIWTGERPGKSRCCGALTAVEGADVVTEKFKAAVFPVLNL